MTTSGVFLSFVIFSALFAIYFHRVIVSFAGNFNFGLGICQIGRQPPEFLVILTQERNYLVLMLLRKALDEAGLEGFGLLFSSFWVCPDAMTDLGLGFGIDFYLLSRCEGLI